MKQIEKQAEKGKASKKRYSIWDNCRYTFCKLRQKEGGGAFAVCLGDVTMSVLLPFLEAALAGAVAACLVSGRGPEEILLLVAGYVAFLQTVRFLQGHIRGRREKLLFLFRADLMTEYFRKGLEMDGQSWESGEGQKKMRAAMRNLYSGNSPGIEAYAKAFCELLLNFCGLAAYSVIVGRRSFLLLLLLILQTMLAAVFHSLAGKRAYRLEEDLEKNWQSFRYLRRESIVPGNGKDIRLYRMDKWFLGLFHEQIGRVVKLTDKEQTGFMAAGIAEKLLSFGRNILVYGYLMLEMAHGNLTLPAFLLYVGVVGGFGAWVNGLFEAAKQIWENEELMDDYRDFMDFGVVEDTGKELPGRPGAPHEIRLENVCFCYDGNASDTIRDLNLTIRAGERLALVGPNGAGKTTLIKLLCGLYRPSSGRIYLDGQDLQTLVQGEVFKEFSIVFQDVFAFSFPLVENVSCLGEGLEDEERLKSSLEEAGLWEKVQELPGGAGTIMNKDLDEEGVSLSGGELQKLMLARALYKGAPIVILDEPTAALDPIAESEMYEKYDEMLQGRTGVFISHRLSSTQFCDRILFLENGRVIEEGSHESLIKRGGAYAELFALQAKNYRRKKNRN